LTGKSNHSIESRSGSEEILQRISFSWEKRNKPHGILREVFKKAIEPLNWTVEYITYGNGVDPPPSYDELIQLIVDNILHLHKTYVSHGKG
jgi:hypothetical protein